MALVRHSGIYGDRCLLLLDVDTNGNVQGAQVENNLTQDVEIVIKRTGTGYTISLLCTPGLHTYSLPGNRKFKYNDAVSDYSVSLTPR